MIDCIGIDMLAYSSAVCFDADFVCNAAIWLL